MQQFILNLSCPDRAGIVAAVSQVLARADMNIAESHQFGDSTQQAAGLFFMRIALDVPPKIDIAAFQRLFAPIAKQYDMAWQVYDAAMRPRVLVMVSKFDHCLQDLIYRTRLGSLKMDIAGVISNHTLAQKTAEQAGLAFHHWAGTKPDTEDKLAALMARENVELVILARYMQILSPTFTDALAGRIINIHHSFLPSFKGADPYSRAYERGVKMIGATAHFVTPDLDEGPIITQGVEDARHDMRVSDLIELGRDVERRTLAHATRLYLQRRILLNGKKTVIFE